MTVTSTIRGYRHGISSRNPTPTPLQLARVTQVFMATASPMCHHGDTEGARGGAPAQGLLHPTCLRQLSGWAVRAGRHTGQSWYRGGGCYQYKMASSSRGVFLYTRPVEHQPIRGGNTHSHMLTAWSPTTHATPSYGHCLPNRLYVTSSRSVKGTFCETSVAFIISCSAAQRDRVSLIVQINMNKI